MNFLRGLKDLRYELFYRWVLRNDLPLVTLGGECQWTISEKGLNSTSAVLCGGAGNDISFEQALIERYHCRVVLLDPSPTGLVTVERVGLPSDVLQFLPLGLAGQNGHLEFAAPVDEAEGSFVGGHSSGTKTHRFECKTLATVMAELGWAEIDLLKIDIEGCEYDVIAQLIAGKVRVKQLCVEFHHGQTFGRSSATTVRAILALRRAGYDLIHRHYWDHTFLLREGSTDR